MVTGWVLIEGEVGKMKRIGQELERVKENLPDGATGKVLSSDTVTGPYDAIVEVEADGVDDLGTFVTDVIQKVDGVLRTTTCLATKLG